MTRHHEAAPVSNDQLRRLVEGSEVYQESDVELLTICTAALGDVIALRPGLQYKMAEKELNRVAIARNAGETVDLMEFGRLQALVGSLQKFAD